MQETRFSKFDLATATTVALIGELKLLSLVVDREPNKYVKQAIRNQIAAIEHTIAIHNARSTAALDGMPEERLIAIGAIVEHSESPSVPRETARELLVEVRRLRGEVAKLSTAPAEPDAAAPRDVPAAAADFGSEAQQQPLDADAADAFERMMRDAGATVIRL